MNGPDPQALKQWADALRWFAKADEDVQMAQLGLNADPPLLEPAAYHCQQAAEKLIKGLLVAAAVKIPHTHDLERLAVLVEPIYPQLAEEIDTLIPITQWATASRYPDLGGGSGADIEDIRDTLARILNLRAGALKLAP